jgi:hypothetical protein
VDSADSLDSSVSPLSVLCALASGCSKRQCRALAIQIGNGAKDATAAERFEPLSAHDGAHSKGNHTRSRARQLVHAKCRTRHSLHVYSNCPGLSPPTGLKRVRQPQPVSLEVPLQVALFDRTARWRPPTQSITPYPLVSSFRRLLHSGLMAHS